ncbi:MAG: hypothetical protein R2824_20130 [Saprospiraceae bacterium]|nr:hypothetical protein [Lewinella sp.]
MLSTLRKFNFGWIVLLLGSIVIISGVSITEGRAGDGTFLCFDAGCIFVQGVTSAVLGFLMVVLGIYLLVRR